MISIKAHAKINWSLKILATRADGYHEMDMLMQSLELCDELTFEPAKWLSLSVDGKRLPVGGRNLIIRAANALNEYMGQRRGARIHLKKNIPVRAGLGGGSADCAAALIALNRLWNLRLPMELLMELGEKLGADVPFCLCGGFARVRGIGEALEPVRPAPRIPLVLMHPGPGLSTAGVFQAWDAGGYPPVPVDIEGLSRALALDDLAGAAACSGNSLEPAAISLLPGVARAMDDLKAGGAKLVRMTGSGSAVFGAFTTEEGARAAAVGIPGALLTWTRAEDIHE